MLPPGFSLRHLYGQAEVAAAADLLAAAFQIDTVTPVWRQRILERADYLPELDVVVEAPDGRLAAFCLCWLNPNGQIGQIEPMGTHPGFQRLGLGRAALLEGLCRLQQLGAHTAYVGTSASNVRSLPMYRSTGFRLHHYKLSYQRTFSP
jgi:ribosomal protein S18 acetylase RimI-like enzyme